MTLKDKIKEVETLTSNTANGVIRDADTILADAIEENDFEVSGIAKNIFNIWKNSSDKKAVEQVFFEFTDIDFEEYFDKCLTETTR